MTELTVPQVVGLLLFLSGMVSWGIGTSRSGRITDYLPGNLFNMPLNPIRRRYYDHLADDIRNSRSRWWCAYTLVVAPVGMVLAGKLYLRGWVGLVFMVLLVMQSAYVFHLGFSEKKEPDSKKSEPQNP